MAEGNGGISLFERADRAAENAWLKLGGRISILATTLIALPIAGWLGARALDQIETHSIAIATLQANVAATERAILALGIGRYTASDATRDLAVINERDAEQDRRLGVHDQQLERLTQSQRYVFPH